MGNSIIYELGASYFGLISLVLSLFVPITFQLFQSARIKKQITQVVIRTDEINKAVWAEFQYKRQAIFQVEMSVRDSAGYTREAIMRKLEEIHRRIEER